MTSTAASQPIINTDLVLLDVNAGGDKRTVIGRLVNGLADAGRTADAEGLTAAAMAREEQSATGLPGGIAIPHCRSPYVDTASIAFARLNPAVDFGAPDGPADLAFLIAAPEAGGAEHMKLLSSLARALVRKDFVEALRNATSSSEVVELVDGVLNATPDKPKPKPASAPTEANPKTLVAITACPTGIAHTYMAADSLVAAAKKAGVTLHVETQGSSGSTPLSAQTIADADAVIFATDVGVRDKQRFAGKPVVASGVKRAINEPDKMVAEALAAAADPDAARVQGDASAQTATAPAGGVGWGTRLRQILLTGVSYMIPFVAAGGLLIALGFLFGGYDIANTPAGDPKPLSFGMNALGNHIAIANTLTDLPAGGLTQYLGAVLFTLGQLAFMFLVPALAGYISFAIADRPGIAPGFTAGAVAVFVGGGFIGGIVGGLIAGFTALWISRIAAPRWLRGLMPVVIIPLVASLVVGLLMFMLLGRPLAAITSGLTHWLGGMTGTSVILLGIVLGLMMCFDLGGPVNKAAYAFATAGLNVADPASLRIMAAVMAAGMVPPLAMALASTVRPALFTEPERENGRAAWLLGASFISEGAIPFAAADPLRVIPSTMFGGAITGALIMAFDVTLKAPHGGIFVFFAIGHLLWFLVALAVGTVAGALAVIAAKQFAKSSAEAEEAPALATA
ncbi:PTS fructose transporter subunit IIABC [Mycolicibacterium moriokaense]|uniref:PTS system D-fructose-specific IIA component (F1P-forming) (Frc family) /PTS system D-fructose-specific IIB component (F1P-forming) (Frc family) /PTS system D-fructose-specific IIC component (F1P-f... n=1 Tax=Mycolicibacterium moriokaense TaxID=39691 RepID=A0A318HAJ6_9MYCO|nr:fructose-specific PTS transporter subunit EIIC [Mycolicibacterium moriokaense]PXX05096.1 PTS system D-fructose-specific IIA component (F1P-forming) (Frc family) /PTS system D-fructose-specific IIB component (F1P-forming) (Frc family) /PTS system D-fructose-specific IIC component (F1P-forming) (Frc family) [Mycolicibacterium moriokaense]